MKNITLTCVMGVDPKKFDLELIPHFIKHYRDMGIEKYLIAINAELEEQTEEGLKILRELGIEPIMWLGEFSEFSKTDVVHQLQERVKTDWTFIVDGDEFVQISDLKALLLKCDKEDYQAVRGNFIDRIALTGKLEHVKPEVSIWDQFPNETNVISLLGGITDKAFIFRTGKYLSSYGNHYVYEKGVKRYWGKSHLLSVKQYYPIRFHVAHFKWTSTCEVRLASRIISFQKDIRHDWVGEIQAIHKCIYTGSLKFEDLDKSKKSVKVDLSKYGYVPGDERWHLIEIPFSDFGNVEFDRITYFIALGAPAVEGKKGVKNYVPGSSYMISDVTWVPSYE